MANKRKEAFIKKAIGKHGDKYNYDKVVYIDNKAKVVIVCPIHGDFLKTPDKHTNGKCEGCQECSMEKRRKDKTSTTEEFIEKANIVHNNKYSYRDTIYERANKKVKIRCPEHGLFHQTPNNHLKGHGCPDCVGVRKLTTEKFISNARKEHGDKYDYSQVNNIININTKVDIICKIHGTFQQTPSVHINGRAGCSKCAGTHNHSNEEYIEIAKGVHGDTYDYSKTHYENQTIKIIVICKVHGEFSTRPADHIHRGDGCPDCRPVGYSKCAIDWLNYLARREGINIQHAENGGEYKIPGTNFSADGYYEGTIYEFHGCFFHACPECYDPDAKNRVSKKINSILYKKTLEREETIRSLGYNLIVIWEHEWTALKKTIPKLSRTVPKSILEDDIEYEIYNPEPIIEDKGKKEIEEEVKEKPKRKPIIIVDSDDEDVFADIIVTEGKGKEEDDTPSSSTFLKTNINTNCIL